MTWRSLPPQDRKTWRFNLHAACVPAERDTPPVPAGSPVVLVIHFWYYDGVLLEASAQDVLWPSASEMLDAEVKVPVRTQNEADANRWMGGWKLSKGHPLRKQGFAYKVGDLAMTREEACAVKSAMDEAYDRAMELRRRDRIKPPHQDPGVLEVQRLRNELG
jgi:hypothetical protein